MGKKRDSWVLVFLRENQRGNYAAPGSTGWPIERQSIRLLTFSFYLDFCVDVDPRQMTPNLLFSVAFAFASASVPQPVR